MTTWHDLQTILPFLGLYFFPWIVAIVRRHHQSASICLLNLFLGWTILGWIAALIWSASEIRREPEDPQTAALKKWS